ncbi:MAG TPA: hypothetical protein VLK84_04850 [Longimicrobium sp.]|nr:hypothetical protein [Longimicrobium sp.]
MRNAMLMVLVAVAVAAGAAPAGAQVLGGPALPAGSTRELSFSITQPEIQSHSSSGAGMVGSYRRTGRVNLSARLAYIGNLSGGTYAEAGSFGVLPVPRIGGVDLGWTAGLGFDTGNGDGLYVPVGLNASRVFSVRGAQVTPFAHGRVAVASIDPQQNQNGRLAAAGELGLEVGAGTRWGIRAGIGNAHNQTSLVMGFAYRR